MATTDFETHYWHQFSTGLEAQQRIPAHQPAALCQWSGYINKYYTNPQKRKADGETDTLTAALPQSITAFLLLCKTHTATNNAHTDLYVH